MPYSFAAAGGSLLTDQNGKVVLCDTGDGYPANHFLCGLRICNLCNLNASALNLHVTATMSAPTKAALVAVKNTQVKHP